MRALILGILSFILTGPVWADSNYLLNTISTQLSAEQWVTSKSALVSVGVNAAVSDNSIETIQDQVLQKLSQISSQGDWHIVSYERAMDKTGLEHLQISAQARLPTNALTGVRDKAKTISKPGEAFSVDDIQFTPSAAELRDANIAVRGDIYQQAKDELARINKMYPDQKYYLHSIDFNMGVVPMVAPMAMAQNAMYSQARTAGGSFAVGDKLVLNATATFAAMSEPAPLKNPHL